MLTKNDLQRLSEIRLEDALHLLQANKASSAYYLAGYSVELGLKACISNLFQENVIPDKGLVNAIYTHSLEALMNTSGLLPELNADIKADAMFGANWGRSSSLLLGWWGIPFGLIVTPIIILMNTVAMFQDPGIKGPTKALNHRSRSILANREMGKA